MQRARYVPQNAAGTIQKSPAAPMKLAPNITADTAEMIMKITLDFISVAILSCLTKNIIHYKSRFVKLYRKKVFPITKKVTIA